jgi:hypothetical protein
MSAKVCFEWEGAWKEKRMRNKKMRKRWKTLSVVSGLAIVVMTGCSGLPGLMDIDSATTEKTTEVHTTETVSETEEKTTEAAIDADAIWDDFIQSGEYRKYTGECYSSARENVTETPDDLNCFKYVRYDLDGDGVNELILEADATNDVTDDDNFNYEWTFGISDKDSIVQADSNLGYGDMRYSAKYSALVGIPSNKPNQNLSAWTFYTYADGEVTPQFTVMRQDGQEILRKGSENEDISGQFDTYMSSCTAFDWIEIKSDGEAVSSGQEDASAGKEEQTEAVYQSEETTEEQTDIAAEEQTEASSGGADSGSVLISSDELCDGYWTQYGQQSWLIKFANDGTAKVYNMIGVIETAQGNSLSGSEIVSDVTYSFDGSILTINDFVNGNTVTLTAHTQDETPGYMTDKQRGAGSVFFYEDGFDSSDPMGEPVVIGRADTSDSMVSAAIDWVESR